MSKRIRPASLLLPLFVLLLIGASVSCGGDETNAQATSSPQAPASGQGESATVRPDGVFTIDVLVGAGWKKSKELDASLLPGATAVWYGFYDQRDIEVRIYPSHGDATGAGTDAALEAIGRSPNSNIGGGIITSLGNRTQYRAYVVAGNLVLLCELSTENCLKLVARMP